MSCRYHYRSVGTQTQAEDELTIIATGTSDDLCQKVMEASTDQSDETQPQVGKGLATITTMLQQTSISDDLCQKVTTVGSPVQDFSALPQEIKDLIYVAYFDGIVLQPRLGLTDVHTAARTHRDRYNYHCSHCEIPVNRERSALSLCFSLLLLTRMQHEHVKKALRTTCRVLRFPCATSFAAFLDIRESLRTIHAIDIEFHSQTNGPRSLLAQVFHKMPQLEIIHVRKTNHYSSNEVEFKHKTLREEAEAPKSALSKLLGAFFRYQNKHAQGWLYDLLTPSRMFRDREQRPVVFAHYELLGWNCHPFPKSREQEAEHGKREKLNVPVMFSSATWHVSFTHEDIDYNIPHVPLEEVVDLTRLNEHRGNMMLESPPYEEEVHEMLNIWFSDLLPLNPELNESAHRLMDNSHWMITPKANHGRSDSPTPSDCSSVHERYDGTIRTEALQAAYKFGYALLDCGFRNDSLGEGVHGDDDGLAIRYSRLSKLWRCLLKVDEDVPDYKELGFRFYKAILWEQGCVQDLKYVSTGFYRQLLLFGALWGKEQAVEDGIGVFGEDFRLGSEIRGEGNGEERW